MKSVVLYLTVSEKKYMLMVQIIKMQWKIKGNEKKGESRFNSLLRLKYLFLLYECIYLLKTKTCICLSKQYNWSETKI